MNELILTEGQNAAYKAFVAFMLSATEKAFVLAGYAGTGKSTLVNKFISDLPDILKTRKLITQEDDDYEWIMTATTNKAAEALSSITQEPVRTIQSLIGGFVQKNYKTGKTKLRLRDDAERLEDKIIFIDEASYINIELLEMIMRQTMDCKIVFIGDPAQLTPVKSTKTPVFAAGFPMAELTEVVRQAEGNPIIDLATAFRNTVNGQDWSAFTPDGVAITHMARDTFDEAIMDEFKRDDWRSNDSKVLSWTNGTTVEYNQSIRNAVQGVPELQIGDYAVCNKYISSKDCTLKTDQTVLITGIAPHTEYGVDGIIVGIDNTQEAFMPNSLIEKKALMKKFKAEEAHGKLKRVDSEWIDLRAAYACTINKSQGSTYDRVFIDLDDIKKCSSANLIARMMYVAVSRAREQVFLVGDLV